MLADRGLGSAGPIYRIMRSELESMGFKELRDYGQMEWNTFKTERSEVSTTCVQVQASQLLLKMLNAVSNGQLM